MPFGKKSRKTSSTGRPPKDPDDTVRGKTDEEKNKYFRHAMRKSRGNDQIQTPEKDDNGEASQPSSSKVGRGRPPLSDEPMTPNTLSNRKRSLMRENYKTRKTSDARTEAAAKRWQMRLNFTGDETIEGEGDQSATLEEENYDQHANLEEVADGDQHAIPFSERTHRFHKQKLQQYLTDNILVNLDLFIHYCKSNSSLLDFDTHTYSLMGHMDQRRIRYHGDILNKFLQNLSCNYAEKVLVFWLDILLQNRIVESVFEEQGWEVPEQYAPTHYKVSQAATQLQKTFLKRDQTTNEQRILGTRYVAEVIKVSGLTTETAGSIQLLAKHTNCSRKFAKLVMEAVERNELENFITRNIRCNAIHANRHWVDEISNFVMKPENTRPVPGQESVSIKYGVRRPKYILRKPRAVIASEFLAENPACPFKASTIMREFPQNAVTATEKDNKRNVCPYHSNARRIVTALHSHEVAKNVPASVRGMCMLNMCDDESIEASDPVQWNRECATGKCHNCPTPSIEIPLEKAKKVISFSLWEYGVDEVKKKKQEAKAKEAKDAEMEDASESGGVVAEEKKKVKTDGRVFRLFRHAASVEETVQLLLEKLRKLKTHTYNAYCQWNAHVQNRSTLDDSSVITIEDYQQNLEIEYNEMPTSMAFTSNKTTVALYPIVVEYNINGVVLKGAIIFLSDDKIHDMQQVSAFEERMFEIMRDKIPHQIVNWQRWTDGAGHEFRSRFCNGEVVKLKEKLNLKRCSFEYFEAHEGKNVSDALGSIIKNKVKRIMLQFPHGVRSAAEIVDLLSVMPDATEKFSFLVVEDFKQISRVPAKERDEVVLPNILKLHSIKVVEGGLLGHEQTCIKCSASELCAECNVAPPTTAIVEEDEEEDEDGDGERVDDEDHQDASDDESEIDDDHNDTDDTNYGYAVWAKYLRTWYPAKVVSPDDIPPSLKRKLQTSEGLIAVQWYGEDRYSLVQRTNTDTLAQNRIDEVRAAVTEQMLIKYNLALSDVHND